MNPILNDCVISVATVNGSGSQSSNNIILRSFFRMGLPCGGKNLFPSNIAGLPTWFTIRVNKDNYVARRPDHDIVIAMNVETIPDDIKSVKPSGIFIYNADLKFDPILLRKDVTNIGVPFRVLVDQATDQIKIKKLLTNMVYVGVLGQLLKIDREIISGVLAHQFTGKKSSVIQVNEKAITAGWTWAAENFTQAFPYQVEAMNENKNKIIIDGNAAGALGMLYGGCTVLAWYPITPSSSVAENFNRYALEYRVTPEGKRNFAVIQSEDELAAIGIVMGAGWAGARAATTTSGPGISLMSEWAGMSYYAEIPGVIWDVQRVGPSTGMPTRTMQADLLKAYVLSHGDTRHPVLLPANPEECFEFGQTCFDLAEQLQTLVFVLSDLDLGMNLFVSKKFQEPTQPFLRGKVLHEEDFKNRTLPFHRYEDVDQDGIPYRTVPGTRDPGAQWLARGSGHNYKGQYTEKPDEYVHVVDRLKKKFETAKTLVPAPIISRSAISKEGSAKIGIIAFGSSDFPMQEARDQLLAKQIDTAYLRVRALPMSSAVLDFINAYDRIYVVEQNRDGQLRDILEMELPLVSHKLESVLHYDGLPLYAEKISGVILRHEQNAKGKQPTQERSATLS